jgi:hypothetical protein
MPGFRLAFDHRIWWSTYQDYQHQFELALKSIENDGDDKDEVIGWAHKIAIEHEILAPVLISVKSTLQRPPRFEAPLRLLTWVTTVFSGT